MDPLQNKWESRQIEHVKTCNLTTWILIPLKQVKKTRGELMCCCRISSCYCTCGTPLVTLLDISIMLLSYINNSRFAEFLPLIYPPELEVKETTDTASTATLLDLYLELDESGQLSTKIYDKRDDYNFKIINLPNVCSNIPASPASGVYISQLIRYARASSNYSDFLKRHLHLRNRLLDQG